MSRIILNSFSSSYSLITYQEGMPNNIFITKVFSLCWSAMFILVEIKRNVVNSPQHTKFVRNCLSLYAGFRLSSFASPLKLTVYNH